MKKILFSLILLSSFVFGVVKDEGKVFKVEEVKALNDRINLLKEQTATDFEVVTLAEENEKVFQAVISYIWIENSAKNELFKGTNPLNLKIDCKY